MTRIATNKDYGLRGRTLALRRRGDKAVKLVARTEFLNCPVQAADCRDWLARSVVLPRRQLLCTGVFASYAFICRCVQRNAIASHLDQFAGGHDGHDG
jgi:hypothetical protein